MIKIINLLNDKTLRLSQEVFVYRNLNRGRLFSIKDKKTGLVVAHADKFRIENVKCKISEAGRQRVIREGRKNVHGQLLGIFTGECEMSIEGLVEVYYDPYTLDSFINKSTGEKLEYIDFVYFEDGRAYMTKNT